MSSLSAFPPIILTVDVEDWFQVENFKGSISYDSWSEREIRVEKNTHILLDLFDSIQTVSRGRTTNPKATFFVLGWIAERFPALVQEIAKRGHEVASHGHMHHLCSKLSDSDLLSDLRKSKDLLEDITGLPVQGYRAPSFDISMKSLSVIESCGFLYDSSYNSFAAHGRYGQVDFSPFKKQGIAFKISESFYEFPVSNLTLGTKIIPWGGGGYFRLTPSLLFHLGVNKIIGKEGAYLFYTHPWEFDPDQPRVQDAPASFKFRHYINLNRTKKKMLGFINEFRNSEFISCENYLTRLS